MDPFFSRIHAVLVGSVATNPSAIVRAMPYVVEAAFWTWIGWTFWLGLRAQWLSITKNTTPPELKMPGMRGFEVPTAVMPDGTKVRARATPDWRIAAWEPVEERPPSDPKVMN